MARDLLLLCNWLLIILVINPFYEEFMVLNNSNYVREVQLLQGALLLNFSYLLCMNTATS